MKTLLKLTVASDFDGKQLDDPTGPIGLSEIGVNRSFWEAQTSLGSFLIPDGESLIIRRDGRNIYVERP